MTSYKITRDPTPKVEVQARLYVCILCVCMFVYCAFVSAKAKQNQKIYHSTIYTEFPVASRYTSTNDARTDCRCWTQAATSL
jgi:hypothetical protein